MAVSKEQERCLSWGHRWSEEPVAPWPDARPAPRGYQYIYWVCDTCGMDKRVTMHRSTKTTSNYYRKPFGYGLHGYKHIDYKFDFAERFHNNNGRH